MKCHLPIFFFCHLCFWDNRKRSHCQIQDTEDLPLTFLLEFYNFSSYTLYVDPCWVSFWILCEVGVKREKAMAPHSSTLAWEIPWTEEPGRLQSFGSLRVRQNWATSLSLFTFMHWRRKWQPTPVFLPGESQGRELGELRSMGSHRVGHDDVTSQQESNFILLQMYI